MEIGGVTVTIWDFAEALRCVVPHSFFSLHEVLYCSASPPFATPCYFSLILLIDEYCSRLF